MLNIFQAFGVETKKRKLPTDKIPAPSPTASTSPGVSSEYVQPKKKYLTRKEKEQLEREALESKSSSELKKPALSIPKEEKVEIRVKRFTSNDYDDVVIPPVEVKKKLRSYGQPVTLFGETDTDRLERLKNFELTLHERQTGSSEGARNIFQDIMEQEVEQELMEANAEGLSAQEVEEKKKEEERAKRRASKYDQHRERPSFKHVEDYIIFWIKRMLHEWEVELSERPKEERDSHKGKVALATHKQTRKYVKALLKLLKFRKTSEDILKHLEKIVDCVLMRDYRKANETYLELSIGNAPWPMGVTMVGIHERAGRAKIFSSQVAHVLNDENQRKYIQALKRLLTFAQHKYPTVPSKLVL